MTPRFMAIWKDAGAIYWVKEHWKQSRSTREDDKFKFGDVEFSMTDIQR